MDNRQETRLKTNRPSVDTFPNPPPSSSNRQIPPLSVVCLQLDFVRQYAFYLLIPSNLIYRPIIYSPQLSIEADCDQHYIQSYKGQR